MLKKKKKSVGAVAYKYFLRSERPGTSKVLRNALRNQGHRQSGTRSAFPLSDENLREERRRERPVTSGRRALFGMIKGDRRKGLCLSLVFKRKCRTAEQKKKNVFLLKFIVNSNVSNLAMCLTR